MPKKGIPDRWLEYSKHGNQIPGTRFITFKVPLSQTLCNRLPLELHWTTDLVLETLPELGLVIDLTNTTRYYHPEVFRARNVQHVKLLCQGRGQLPERHVLDNFIYAVSDFLNDPHRSAQLIGVHCTHGLNRTGFFICWYMIEQMGFTAKQAIAAFNDSRGHRMERAPYLDALARALPAPGVRPRSGFPSRSDDGARLGTTPGPGRSPPSADPRWQNGRGTLEARINGFPDRSDRRYPGTDRADCSDWRHSARPSREEQRPGARRHDEPQYGARNAPAEMQPYQEHRYDEQQRNAQPYEGQNSNTQRFSEQQQYDDRRISDSAVYKGGTQQFDDQRFAVPQQQVGYAPDTQQYGERQFQRQASEPVQYRTHWPGLESQGLAGTAGHHGLKAPESYGGERLGGATYFDASRGRSDTSNLARNGFGEWGDTVESSGDSYGQHVPQLVDTVPRGQASYRRPYRRSREPETGQRH